MRGADANVRNVNIAKTPGKDIPGARGGTRAASRRWTRPQRLCDEAVEPRRVVAGDLADGGGRQVPELLLDVLRGLRPHPVAVGIVRAPHERLLADLVDHLGADAVELEGGLALPAPVV